MSADAQAARQLGRLLTGTEAKEIADRLADGDTLTAALKAVASGRRDEVRSLLESAELASPTLAVPLLRAVEGARSIATTLSALWTMPGHLAQSGPLTSSVVSLVENARESITCSTYNFQKSSGLWGALRSAASRPEIAVRIYLDARAADHEPTKGTPNSSEVAAHLRPGVVLRTKHFDGAFVRNHAKFLVVDHRFVLVTSANLSWSAEYGNVELGIRIDNRNLAEAIEREMREAEALIYERVRP